MQIKQNLTSINYNSSNNRNIKYIVVHYTGNSTDTAYNNTKYFKSVNRNSSAHYFVDDNEIWQCVLDKNISWHCGGKKQSNNGGNFYGKCTNQNSIGIEMCCINYNVSEKTENNTIELIKLLMKKYNIPVNNIIRHFDVVGKNCPAPMVQNQSRWNNFKEKLGGNGNISPSNAGNISITTCTGDITYCVYDNTKKQYLPSIINDKGYAGNVGNPIGGIKAKCKNGNLYIQSHVIGKPTNEWEDIVILNASNYNSKSGSAYSGILGKNIDCVKIWCDYGYVTYRVSPLKGNYYDWIDSRNRNNNTPNSYAGVYGKPIDRIQMK